MNRTKVVVAWLVSLVITFGIGYGVGDEYGRERGKRIVGESFVNGPFIIYDKQYTGNSMAPFEKIFLEGWIAKYANEKTKAIIATGSFGPTPERSLIAAWEVLLDVADKVDAQ
jgi:hypothetical protein